MFHVEHFSQRPWQPMLENRERFHVEQFFLTSRSRDASGSPLWKDRRQRLPTLSSCTGISSLYLCTEIRHCNSKPLRTILRTKLSAPPKKLKWDASSL